MKLTIIHPCVGRRPGQPYVRSWQMEPLPAAHLAGLTPPDVQVSFFDDRLEAIDYERPTDLVAMSVETYTAKRAYQIASHYRRRGVPVVMGGFHPTLVPDEVQEYAESIVLGEAEAAWPRLLQDFSEGRLQPRYKVEGRPDIGRVSPQRRIFAGKDYLKIGLVEVSRGCTFRCEFCAVQSFFGATQTHRDLDAVLREIAALRDEKKLFFFVDDNIVAKRDEAKAFFRELARLRVRWVGQATSTMAQDEELLSLMKASGCQGVLIGFESLDPDSLRAMNKGFNLHGGGPEAAVRTLHRLGIRIYATFIFGYDRDDEESFRRAVGFCKRHKIFMVAFNHLTPFPGTPLYARLEREGRLLYDKWWLDERYRYGQVPFRTKLAPERIQALCVEARKSFYSIPSIAARSFSRQHLADPYMYYGYLFINFLLRREATQRENYPLGDESDREPILKARQVLLR
ncbi:MAG TPA: radical SAM protein [Elusimicrobiota bacterium]|nr:radical SAM protein [Elusimicrobiota bacterium]